MSLREGKAMDRIITHTSNAPAAIGPYSQAVVTSEGMVFTAGQIAIDPATGAIVEGGIRQQTARVMENLRAVLEASGSGLERVVKTTVFLADMGEFADMNEVYGSYFTSNPPARSTVQVSRLPRDVRVEIEAIALVIR
jgi:2-iminobutanoate/2-iminopropanoate deaminase